MKNSNRQYLPFRGPQGEGDRLVEEGDDGECGRSQPRAGMEVARGMEQAARARLGDPRLGYDRTLTAL